MVASFVPPWGGGGRRTGPCKVPSATVCSGKARGPPPPPRKGSGRTRVLRGGGGSKVPLTYQDSAWRAVGAVRAAVALGDLVEARQLWDTFVQAWFPQIHPMNAVLKAFSRALPAAEVEQMVDAAARDLGFQPDASTFSILMAACVRQGTSVDHVVRLFDAMQREHRVAPTISCYNTLLNAFVKGGAVADAERVFQEQLCGNVGPSAVAEAEAPTPDIVTFNTMLKMYRNTARLDKMNHLRRVMEQYHIPPDAISLNIFLDALGANGRLEEAKRLFDANKETLCDVVSYTTMMKYVALDGDVPQVQRYFAEMQEREQLSPSVFSYAVLIDALGKSGDVVAAQRAMETMQHRDGLRPNVVCYTALMKSFSAAGRIAEVERLYRRMRKGGIRPTETTYSVLIDAFGSQGRLPEAEELYADMVRAGIAPSLVTFNVMMKMYAARSQVAKVKATFDELVRVGCIPDGVTYNTLIHAHAKVQDGVAVECAFLEMRANKVKADVVTWNTIMKVFASRGQVESVLAVLEDMSALNVVPDQVTFNILVDTFVTAQRPTEEAMHVLSLMDRHGLRPNVITFTTLMKMFLSRDELDLVVHYFEEILAAEQTPTPLTCRLLADALAAKYGPGEACTYIDHFRLQLDMAVLYNALIGAFAKLGDRAAVHECMHRMSSLSSASSSSVSSPPPGRSVITPTVDSCLALLGDHHQHHQHRRGSESPPTAPAESVATAIDGPDPSSRDATSMAAKTLAEAIRELMAEAAPSVVTRQAQLSGAEGIVETLCQQNEVCRPESIHVPPLWNYPTCVAKDLIHQALCPSRHATLFASPLQLPSVCAHQIDAVVRLGADLVAKQPFKATVRELRSIVQLCARVRRMDDCFALLQSFGLQRPEPLPSTSRTSFGVEPRRKNSTPN